MVAAGATAMVMLSDKFSKVNKEVRLYEMVMQNEAEPQVAQSLELQAFYGQEERTVEDLATEVTQIKQDFRLYSGIIGAFFGLVIALSLINLSTKRTRKLYEIDDANCVCCGKCFGYCPKNLEE